MSKPKVALITGGARGIGRGIGLELAARGWRVALCYRTSEDDAQRTAEEIESAGGKALVERCDVSDPDAVERLFETVESKWSAVEVLVNAAGPYHRAKILDETVDGWRSMFANNLDSVFYTCRRAAPKMIENNWGRIINFSMANADRIAANMAVTAHYIAKSGVLSLSRAFAKALAPHEVTVNCISPGFIDSKSAPAEELEAMTKRIPAGYVGTVSDVISTASFLLSENARYITGSNLHVSGGWGV